MISYEQFRSNALQGLTLLPYDKQPLMSKDDLERWVQREYNRHYALRKKPRLDRSSFKNDVLTEIGGLNADIRL